MAAAIRPAVLHASANAQVVNASAVGSTPRYYTLSVARGGTLPHCGVGDVDNAGHRSCRG
jgi:hypothetical protein